MELNQILNAIVTCVNRICETIVATFVITSAASAVSAVLVAMIDS